MGVMSLQVQIKSLEAQLSVLKAQLASCARPARPGGCFADLYGILSGKSGTTEEELRETEYRFDWLAETWPGDCPPAI